MPWGLTGQVTSVEYKPISLPQVTKMDSTDAAPAYQPTQHAPWVGPTTSNAAAFVMVAADKYYTAKQALADISDTAKTARKELKRAEQELVVATQMAKDMERSTRQA